MNKEEFCDEVLHITEEEAGNTLFSEEDIRKRLGEVYDKVRAEDGTQE